MSVCGNGCAASASEQGTLARRRLSGRGRTGLEPKPPRGGGWARPLRCPRPSPARAMGPDSDGRPAGAATACGAPLRLALTAAGPRDPPSSCRCSQDLAAEAASALAWPLLGAARILVGSYPICWFNLVAAEIFSEQFLKVGMNDIFDKFDWYHWFLKRTRVSGQFRITITLHNHGIEWIHQCKVQA